MRRHQLTSVLGILSLVGVASCTDSPESGPQDVAHSGGAKATSNGVYSGGGTSRRGAAGEATRGGASPSGAQSSISVAGIGTLPVEAPAGSSLISTAAGSGNTEGKTTNTAGGEGVGGANLTAKGGAPTVETGADGGTSSGRSSDIEAQAGSGGAIAAGGTISTGTPEQGAGGLRTTAGAAGSETSGEQSGASGFNTAGAAGLGAGGGGGVHIGLPCGAMGSGRILFELGHTTGLRRLQFEGSRVLSHDFNGHWVLWDYLTAAILASGDTAVCEPDSVGATSCDPILVDLAGPLLVVQGTSELEVRGSSDGQVISRIPWTGSWWRLESDGSYVCGGSQSGLFVWGPDAQLQASRAGDYSKANVFAASREIRIALGPMGANVIETFSIATEESSQENAFSGQFDTWFVDGERFMTSVSTSVKIYSKDVVQEGTYSFTEKHHYSGRGNWFWPLDGDFKLYAVDGNGTPALTRSGCSQRVTSQRGLVALCPTGLAEIDLSVATPILSEYAYSESLLKAATLSSAVAVTKALLAVNSDSRWVIEYGNGQIRDGGPVTSPTGIRAFSCGPPQKLLGSGDRVVVNMGYKLPTVILDAHTRAIENQMTIPYSDMELSADGAVLAYSTSSDSAAGFGTIATVELPSGTEMQRWAVSPGQENTTNFLSAFSLSASGEVLGRLIVTRDAWSGATTMTAQGVSSVTGAPVWSIGPMSNLYGIRLSPDGTLVAMSNLANINPSAATNIFKNGKLVSTVEGMSIGWIDNIQLLANRYFFLGAGTAAYDATVLYDTQGTAIASFQNYSLDSPYFRPSREFQVLAGDAIYLPATNGIYSATNGMQIWSSSAPSLRMGAIVSGQVVFASGHQILIEPL